MTTENKYTIEEIRKYLESQDSFGDCLYYLNDENIQKANVKLPSIIELYNKIIQESSGKFIPFSDTEYYSNIIYLIYSNINEEQADKLAKELAELDEEFAYFREKTFDWFQHD